MKRIGKMFLIILIVSVFLSLLFIAYGTGVNNRFYKLVYVTSNSMYPVFEAGDLIMIIRADPEQIKVGDIVTFQTRDGSLLTHRVAEIKSDGEIVTKGDANEEIDSWSDGWKLGKVETKYVFKIPKVGYAISWLQGLFSTNSTGAWLEDVQKMEFGLKAGQQEVVAKEIPIETTTETTPEVIGETQIEVISETSVLQETTTETE